MGKCKSRAQLAILTALNDHLRDELEDNETRHDQALGDILVRLQAAQNELEHLRSNHELSVSGLKVRESVCRVGVFRYRTFLNASQIPPEREGSRVQVASVSLVNQICSLFGA